MSERKYSQRRYTPVKSVEELRFLEHECNDQLERNEGLIKAVARVEESLKIIEENKKAVEDLPELPALLDETVEFLGSEEVTVLIRSLDNLKLLEESADYLKRFYEGSKRKGIKGLWNKLLMKLMVKGE